MYDVYVVDGLPAPFHGQGQYSHQVGMQLTPGLTPNNSGICENIKLKLFLPVFFPCFSIFAVILSLIYCTSGNEKYFIMVHCIYHLEE